MKKWVRDFEIGGQVVKPGERALVSLKIPSLFDCTELSIPVHVIRGKVKGPTVFVSAAVHGDEINGVEVCRKLLKKNYLKKIKGTLLVIPIVNVFGFNSAIRYLPDRRDLNRSFPGNKKGSLASRMAHIFMSEVVSKCDYGIDLHTGAIHRSNLPQVRISLKGSKIKDLAKCFGTKVILDSKLRDGSLREAAYESGTPVLLFEGGQALRFERPVIEMALKGISSVLSKLEMIPEVKRKKVIDPLIAKSSTWLRAKRSGVFSSSKKLGDHVSKGEIVGRISDLSSDTSYTLKSKYDGLIIGMSLLPLVNEGDALFNVATTSRIKEFDPEYFLLEE